MSFLGFLLILFLIFVGIPLFKVGWKIYRMQKDAKKVFSQFNQQQQSRAEEFESQQRRQQQRQRRKSMGEYVEFEDINFAQQEPSNTQKTSSKKSYIKDEPLISDAEWEEIK